MTTIQISIDKTVKSQSIKTIMKFALVFFLVASCIYGLIFITKIEWEQLGETVFSFWSKTLAIYIFTFIQFIVANLCFCLLLVFAGKQLFQRPYFHHPLLRDIPYLLIGFLYIFVIALHVYFATMMFNLGMFEGDHPLLFRVILAPSPTIIILKLLYYYIAMYFAWDLIYRRLFAEQVGSEKSNG